ncbi:MAG TPA: hypothetical protein VK488_13635 [Gaiellaceae bacterium]|nr:hypothetical protein [Gaiellaceae bacterium]
MIVVSSGTTQPYASRRLSLCLAQALDALAGQELLGLNVNGEHHALL